MGRKKHFVLDTNVFLHDYRSLFNFQENDIYIPIVVLEELDKFKKGGDQINYNAREFIRELDELTSDDLITKGVSLGPDLGKLSVIANSEYAEEVRKAFPERSADHQILSDTLYIARKYPRTPTILVTKDINLRIKARSLGITTENYQTDNVQNIDRYDREHDSFFVSQGIVDELYKGRDGIPAQEVDLGKGNVANNCFLLNGEHSNALACLSADKKRILRVDKMRNFGIDPRNAEQAFALHVLNDPNISLVAITGKAGTGKTLLALAAALQQNQLYKQILLARPIVALANKDLGFLPGDEKQKIAPYMQPLFDNLNVIKHQFSLEGSDYRLLQKIQESGQLVIEALAYIRGRSLNDTFCIIDEAQNLTPHEIKTIITRSGEGTKMVFTGDIQQIDSPYLDTQSNGLVYTIDKMRDQPLFAHVNLVKGERSALSELASNLL